jgi:hypothetical protein
MIKKNSPENDMFVEACNIGDLAKVKSFLLQKKTKHLDLNLGLEKASQGKQTHIMKFLLASPEIKEHADIHSSDDSIFRTACMRGDLEFVKYLLTSPEIKEHANLHAMSNDGFASAWALNRLEVMKYLLHSPDLKTHPDIYKDEWSSFGTACENESWDTLRYLIIDLNMKKTSKIIEELSDKPCPIVEEMFRKQQLISELNKELANDKSVENGIKKPKL